MDSHAEASEKRLKIIAQLIKFRGDCNEMIAKLDASVLNNLNIDCMILTNIEKVIKSADSSDWDEISLSTENLYENVNQILTMLKDNQ